MIQDNAWIGSNVTVLAGVAIGANAVVDAASVVTKDVFDQGRRAPARSAQQKASAAPRARPC